MINHAMKRTGLERSLCMIVAPLISVALTAASSAATATTPLKDEPPEMPPPLYPGHRGKTWVTRGAERQLQPLPINVPFAEKVAVLNQQQQLSYRARGPIWQLQPDGSTLPGPNDRKPDILSGSGWFPNVRFGPAPTRAQSRRNGWAQSNIRDLERQQRDASSRVNLAGGSQNYQVRPLFAESHSSLNTRDIVFYKQREQRNDNGRISANRGQPQIRADASAGYRYRIDPGLHAVILFIFALLTAQGLYLGIYGERVPTRLAGIIIAGGIFWLLFFQ